LKIWVKCQSSSTFPITTLKKRVNASVKKIIEYIGSEDEFNQTSTIEALSQPLTTEELGSVIKILPEGIKEVLIILQTGNTWNALALLRRNIEMLLRKFVTGYYGKIQPMPLSQMILWLEGQDFITHETSAELRTAVDICNKAVHGFDVTYEEANEAVRKAIFGLNDIDRIIKERKL
jgi:hypothetical protein